MYKISGQTLLALAEGTRFTTYCFKLNSDQNNVVDNLCFLCNNVPVAVFL